MKNQKLRLLSVMKILLDYSDEQHPLNAQDILGHLLDLGIVAERKAIYDDIAVLMNFNLDIIACTEKKLGYFIAQRDFELSELRLLVDAVQSSQFITVKKSEQLIQKITSLAPFPQRPKLGLSNFYAFAKSENEQILYNVDQIQEAIQTNVEITFQYFDISIHSKKKYRKQSSLYSLKPYALVWENQRYYCIGYSKKHQSFSHYRIDKMDHLKCVPLKSEPLAFDLQDYLSKVFGMYSSPQVNITLQFETALSSIVFDQFGQDILIQSYDDEHFIINLNLSLAPPFIGWLFQFKDQIKILSPQSLIDEMKNIATTIINQYSDEDKVKEDTVKT